MIKNIPIKGLTLQRGGEFNCPQLICQYCGEPIRNEKSNYEKDNFRSSKINSWR